MIKFQLSDMDRNFFTLVADATFTNPFSPRRRELDLKISGATKAKAREQIIPEVIRRIEKRLKDLDKQNAQRISDFTEPDQELMRYVYLFDIYHHFTQRFDDLIVRQEKTGMRSLKVSFAEQVINELLNRGFEQPIALRLISMFYQIRRAFYLIARALIGPSPCMQKLRMDLWNNIFTHDIRHYEKYMWDRMEDFSTLLEGPTGCGKGAAAAAIGMSGFIPYDTEKNCFQSSFTDTLIDVNLAQFTPSLIESELFGHAKGAFTGAIADYDGVFVRCGKHGTIFLDEISEIQTNLQVKLLRVLQERTFWPVGSHKQVHFYGRVIGATNKPVSELLTSGRFREDFYYRLCADCIQVPSLQQRIAEDKNELPSLVEHFVRQIIGRDENTVTRMVLEVIDQRLGPNYEWPGNVRELAQCIRRVILKQDYEKESHEIKGSDTFISEDPADFEEITAQQLLSRYCTMLYDKHNSYEKVARITNLDRRTVKKHIQMNFD